MLSPTEQEAKQSFPQGDRLQVHCGLLWEADHAQSQTSGGLGLEDTILFYPFLLLQHPLVPLSWKYSSQRQPQGASLFSKSPWSALFP